MIVSRPQWLSDTEEGTMMLPWRGAEGAGAGDWTGLYIPE